MNSFQSPIEQYCRKVKRQLVCHKTTKACLIDGLRTELQDRFPNCTNYDKILSDYGYPEVIAGELQEAVELPEYHNAWKKKKITMTIITSAVILLCISLTIGYVYMLSQESVAYYKDIIVQDETYPFTSDTN